MSLFTRSCHGPNGRFTLSCAASVFGTQLMPYFVNSTSIVSNNVIRRYIRVKFKVKVNWGQSWDMMLLWPEVKFSTWPPEVKKYMFRCILRRGTRWCLNYSAIFLSSKVICEKREILTSLSFFLWPDLEGSRYDLKRSTRVPLDSEHPKDLFGLCPTVIS